MLKKLKVVLLLFLSIFTIGSIDKEEVFAATSTNQYYAVNVPLNTNYTETIWQGNTDYWYKFKTTSNDSFYRFVYKNLSIDGNCYFTIYTTDNEKVYSDYAGYNSEYYSDLKLNKDTTYYVKVRTNYSNYTGNYRFSVNELRDDVGSSKGSSKRANLNNAYTKAINATGNLDEDWYKFTTTSNNAFYRLNYKNISIDSNCYFYIYSKDNELIYSDYAGYNGSYYKDLKLSRNTTYYLKVVSRNTGNYRFSINELKDDVGSSISSAKDISLNAAVRGKINATVDVDWFKFKTTSGSRYTFDYKNLDIDDDCYFKIYSSYNELIYSSYAYDGEDYESTLTLLPNRTYYVKVESSKTGEYNFGIVTENPLSKVVNLQKTENTRSNIKLKWNKVSGASGYQVYRSTSRQGSYTKVGTVRGNSSITFNDTGLTPGQTYYYKVRAYKVINSRMYVGSYSSVMTTATKTKTPSITVTSPKIREARISWSKIYGSSGYEVYRSTRSGGTYTKVKTLSSSTLSYKDKSVSRGSTYYYKVRTYKTVNGKNIYSSFSSIKSVKIR